MDVPLLVLEPVSDEEEAEMIELPGAMMSLHGPKLLYDARVLEGVVAPTVIACSAKAGEYPHESPLELPAATTTVTPACVAAPIAVE